MRAVDLYCGCGGMSAGLRMAGVEVLAGVDKEEKYLSTFKKNFGSTSAHELDLTSISPQEILDRIGLSRNEIDILVGGPPCQGFSKNVPRKHRQEKSKNNLQVQTFLGFCEFLRPSIIIMENVAEMKNGFKGAFSNEVVERLSGCGYSVVDFVVNAADFGIPQRRRRAFFLASRDYGVTPPKSTHIKPKSQQENLFCERTHVTVWEAIGDLPSLQHGEGDVECEYSCKPFSQFQSLMRGDSHVVRNHVARQLRPRQLARLQALKPGQGHKDLPPELQIKGGYSGAYGRLTEEMVAPTITRWVFHPGSGRWGHPRDTRLLSIREVARIQGFPDSFEFVGTYIDQAGQLGNAVPPHLIKAIFEAAICQESEK